MNKIFQFSQGKNTPKIKIIFSVQQHCKNKENSALKITIITYYITHIPFSNTLKNILHCRSTKRS